MKLNAITATLATLCLGWSAAPAVAASDEATTGSKAALAAEPGGISNGYISYRENPTGAFNHEVGGKFTLATAERGAIAQLFYSVTYDFKKAAYVHEEGQAPYPDGFDTKTTHTAENGKIISEVRTDDGAIAIRNETSCGKGPYVVRKMQVTNTGKKTLNQVQLLFTVNLDTLDWENEAGKVDAEASQAYVYNAANTQWAGLAAEPKPAFLSTDEVSSLLDPEAGSYWNSPSAGFNGNAATQVGWQVGPLEPGQSKTVELTIANTNSEADLKKALSREAFPER